ncbi:MAG: hypothetical protein JW789_01820 [Candidatus Aenigmarchaeota archaeon]|nr:hypothetical protein [Candidatus Aenigmarchaeota archaeon]
MKKTGKCPKCSCPELFHAGKIHTWAGEGLSLNGGIVSSGHQFEAYVCTKCGYTEIYMPEKRLSFVKEKFTSK